MKGRKKKSKKRGIPHSLPSKRRRNFKLVSLSLTHTHTLSFSFCNWRLECKRVAPSLLFKLSSKVVVSHGYGSINLN